jgi:hypothetical protein
MGFGTQVAFSQPAAPQPNKAANAILWDFIIDTLTLSAFEVPEEFEIGFEKQLAVHKTLSSNGTSQINTTVLGVFPLPTSWTGTLYGANALPRYQQLERLATQPADVIWKYGPLQYNVQVQKVTGKPRSPIEFHYEISLIIKQALTQNGSIPTLDPAFDISTATFLSNGQTLGAYAATNGIFPTALAAQYTAINNQITAASPIRNASYPTLFALSINLAAFNQAVYALLAAQEAQKLDATGNSNFLTLLGVYTNYSQFASQLGTLIGGTIGNQLITAGAGTNLFAISQQFYPNLSASDGANLIAQANQLADYFVTAPTTLTIPTLSL